MNKNSQTTPDSPPPLDELLWHCYSSLLVIKRRLHFLQAYSEASDSVTRGKPFRIRNDIVYNMVLDVRDKCVIDLYSLTVAMRHGVRTLDPDAPNPDLRKNGLFSYLRKTYLARFKRIYERQAGDWDDEYALHQASTAERFGRLFPNCKGDTPTIDDISLLCEQFRLKMRPLGKDRNKNRAHAHEGDLGTAKMHSFEELAALFEYTEDLLEDLSLLSASTSYARQDMNQACCKKTSEDTVDLVLLGYSEEIIKLRTERSRSEAYSCLHALDDASDEGDKTLFNDRLYHPELGLFP